jgi:hypothetical protein
MKIFRWDSAALKQYSQGDILAIGRDAEEARAAARAHFDKISTRHYADMMVWFNKGWEPDEDDIERRDEMLRLLEADIMKEPEVSDAFFIDGGE